MKQLDPKSVWLFFVSFFWRWFFMIVILTLWGGTFLFSREGSPDDVNLFSVSFLGWLWFIIPTFLVVCFIWAKLSYHFYRYELTELGFRKESGVLYKKYVTIPYDRIQNVDINRGLLSRILGLSDLQIQTAGASAVVSRGMMAGVGSEGRLPGLSKDIAEQLRNELIKKTHQSKNQGL